MRYNPETRRLQEVLPSGEVISEGRVTYGTEEEAMLALRDAVAQRWSPNDPRRNLPLDLLNRDPIKRVNPQFPDTREHIGFAAQGTSYSGSVFRNVYVAPDGTRYTYYTYAIGSH